MIYRAVHKKKHKISLHEPFFMFVFSFEFALNDETMTIIRSRFGLAKNELRGMMG